MKQASRIYMATCLLALVYLGSCAVGAQATAAARHRKLRAVDADGSIVLFNAGTLPQAIAVGEPNPGLPASPGPVIVDPAPSPSPRIITDPLPHHGPVDDVCYNVDNHDSSVITVAKFAVKTIDEELSALLQEAFHTSKPIKYSYVSSAQRCDMPSWDPSQPGLMRYTMTVMVWVPYHKGHQTFYYKAPISVEVSWYTDSDMPQQLNSITYKGKTWPIVLHA